MTGREPPQARPAKRRRTSSIGLALAGGGPLGGIYEVGTLLALSDSIEHLDFAVGELGFKAALMASYVPRPTNDGVHYDVFGVDSAEIIGMLQVAMIADLPYTALRDSMSAHPTLVGSLNNLFAALESCKPLKMENTHEPANIPDRHQGVA